MKSNLPMKVAGDLKLLSCSQRQFAAADVESFLTEMLIDFRNKLTGLGHKLAAQLEGKKASQICAAIDSEVEATLKELSETLHEEYSAVEEARLAKFGSKPNRFGIFAGDAGRVAA